MVGLLVEVRQEESMSDAAPGSTGSRATGRVEESDLSPAKLGALFLNIELGIHVCIHRRSMHTAQCLGQYGRKLAAAVPYQWHPGVWVPRFVTSRAQAEVVETKTAWLGRGSPGSSGRRG